MPFIRRIASTVAIGLSAFGAMGPCCAQDQSSVEEVKAFIGSAIAHIKAVGVRQAFADFSIPGSPWRQKDLYIFAYRQDGTNVAHGVNPGLIGKNLMALQDEDGQPLIRNMANVAEKQGAGWVNYQWANPKTHMSEDKTAYVEQIPNYQGFIGASVKR